MICRKCRRPISKSELPKAHIEKNDKGAIRAALHNKCWHQENRRRDLDALDRNTAPSPYEQSATRQTADDLTDEAKRRRQLAEAELERLRAMNPPQAEVELEMQGEKISMDDLMRQAEQQVVLTKRQEEIARERELEEAPRVWTDHRDPIEREI